MQLKAPFAFGAIFDEVLQRFQLGVVLTYDGSLSLTHVESRNRVLTVPTWLNRYHRIFREPQSVSRRL